MYNRMLTTGLGLALLLLAAGTTDCAFASGLTIADAGRLGGGELVQRLHNADDRSVAFYELARRNCTDDKITDYAAFLNDHYEPEILACPQGDTLPPIIVVMYGFLDCRMGRMPSDYDSTDDPSLFTGVASARSWDEPALMVFDADGKEVRPFGGHNVLSTGDTLADLDGDGWIEWVTHGGYGIHDSDIRNINVMRISAIRTTTVPLANVLYNWGTDEWDIQVVAGGRDKRNAVRLGPKTDTGIDPKLTFDWDGAGKLRQTPTALAGDHYRVMATGTDTAFWQELKGFAAAGLTFTGDPASEPTCERHIASMSTGRSTGLKIQPQGEPYRYSSLQGLTDTEIIDWMGDGKTWQDYEETLKVKTSAPAAFWELPPDSAALMLADANRLPEHRALWQLALDTRDGARPPETMNISFADYGDRSYFVHDSLYSLTVAPGASYLVYANQRGTGEVFYNFVYSRPSRGFRMVPVEDAVARQVGQVIWWLDRVRSYSNNRNANRFGSTGMWSSADGHGALTMCDGSARTLMAVDESMWATDNVSERWNGEYDKAVFLNLVNYLMQQTLTRKLGDAWPAVEPLYGAEHDTAWYEQQEREDRRISREIMARWTPDGRGIALPIVTEAIHDAGARLDTMATPLVENILRGLPVRSQPLRTMAELRAANDAFDSAERQVPVRQRLDYSSAHREERQQLRQEMTAARYGLGEYAVEQARAAAQLALKKFAAADDSDQLLRWACSREPGYTWALQQLAWHHRAQYVTALNWWTKNSQEEWARQAFDALTRADTAVAEQRAREAVSDTSNALTVPAYSVLAGIDRMADSGSRVATLIAYLREPAHHWMQRWEAISMLVPDDTPLLYPQPEVDKVLVDLVTDTKLADLLLNSTMGQACRALARRGRSEYFDLIARQIETAEGSTEMERLLSSLATLAWQESLACAPKLQSFLARHLVKTRMSVEDVVWTAWAGNVRGLAPRMVEIATAGPGTYENQVFSSSLPYQVTGRWHLARKVASLWHEEDALTRGKLLIAFGFAEAFYFLPEGGYPERTSQMLDELTAVNRDLPAVQRAQLGKFLADYVALRVPAVHEKVYRERMEQFAQLAQGRLNAL